jgi:hypothetical protein
MTRTVCSSIFLLELKPAFLCCFMFCVLCVIMCCSSLKSGLVFDVYSLIMLLVD